jgi:hypothetical protein
MRDEIVLTLPQERDFFDVAHLVVGGLAARLDLTIEHLEDIQLALESVLPLADGSGTVTLALQVGGDAIRYRVGPIDGAALERQLERGPFERVLETVADGWTLDDVEGQPWILLTKRVQTA